MYLKHRAQDSNLGTGYTELVYLKSRPSADANPRIISHASHVKSSACNDEEMKMLQRLEHECSESLQQPPALFNVQEAHKILDQIWLGPGAEQGWVPASGGSVRPESEGLPMVRSPQHFTLSEAS